jgi:hypothetical protein
MATTADLMAHRMIRRIECARIMQVGGVRKRGRSRVSIEMELDSDVIVKRCRK